MIGKCSNCGATGRIPSPVFEQLEAAARKVVASFKHIEEGEFGKGLVAVEVKVLCCKKPDWTWFSERSDTITKRGRA